MQYAERAYYTEQAEHQFLLALRERIERIVRWYVRTGDDDVADLTQECLLRVYNKLDSIRDLDKMEPWLKSVVRNTVFTWLRERKREQEVCSVGLDAENETDTYCLPEDDLLLYFILQDGAVAEVGGAQHGFHLASGTQAGAGGLLCWVGSGERNGHLLLA